MPTGDPFAYALLQLVPDLERGERVNVGVVLFCRQRDFLALRWHLHVERLATLAPALDVDALASQLRALEQIAAGEQEGGALSELPASERFHWLIAPASTMLVASESHTGISEDPGTTLERLFERLVA